MARTVKGEESKELETKIDNPAHDVLQRVNTHLTRDCPYAYCFRDIKCVLCNGVLTLQGKVPSFYLKQVLQTLLRDVEGIEQIDNQVDVISSSGLSSVRAK